MSISPEVHSTTAGHSPSGAAAVASEEITAFFSTAAPVTEAEALDQISRTCQVLEQTKVTMALYLARMQDEGVLLEHGGHRTLAAWIMNNLGMGRTEATNLARVASCFHRQELPDTAEQFWAGFVSLGEAAAIARAVERETNRRDAEHEDAVVYARMIEAGLVEHKRQVPHASVSDLNRQALMLGHRYSPERFNQQEKKVEAGRGAVLHQAKGGGFLFQAWGSGLDGAILNAHLESFTGPYDASVSREERFYTAFLGLVRSAGDTLENPDAPEAEGAEGAEARPTPVALVNITVPVSTLVGLEGDDPALTDSGAVLYTSQVRAMLGENLVRYLLTDEDGNTVKVSSRQRIVPDKVRAAAFAGHSTCAWAQGCDVPIRYAQADHKVEFHRGGASTPENVQPLCSMHNRLKHRLQTEEDHRFWKGRPGTSPRPQDPDPYPEQEKQKKRDRPPPGGRNGRRP